MTMKFKIIGDIKCNELLNSICFDQIQKKNKEIIHILFKQIKNENSNMNKKLEMLIVYLKKIKKPYDIEKDSRIKQITNKQTEIIFIEENSLENDHNEHDMDIQKQIFFVDSSTNKLNIENNSYLEELCFNNISYMDIMKIHDKI